MEPFLSVLYILFFVMCYFLPYFVAKARGHKSLAAIGMLTLLLGWTGILWVFALIWSLTGNTA